MLRDTSATRMRRDIAVTAAIAARVRSRTSINVPGRLAPTSWESSRTGGAIVRLVGAVLAEQHGESARPVPLRSLGLGEDVVEGPLALRPADRVVQSLLRPEPRNRLF